MLHRTSGQHEPDISGIRQITLARAGVCPTVKLRIAGLVQQRHLIQLVVFKRLEKLDCQGADRPRVAASGDFRLRNPRA